MFLGSVGVYLAEFGLSAAVLLDQMLQLVVDVFLSAAHLLQSLTDVLLQFVQVTLQRQERTHQDAVTTHSWVLLKDVVSVFLEEPLLSFSLPVHELLSMCTFLLYSR